MFPLLGGSDAAYINDPMYTYTTPYIPTYQHPHVITFHLHISTTIDATAVDGKGRTALHLAAVHGKAAAVGALLEASSSFLLLA